MYKNGSEANDDDKTMNGSIEIFKVFEISPQVASTMQARFRNEVYWLGMYSNAHCQYDLSYPQVELNELTVARGSNSLSSAGIDVDSILSKLNSVQVECINHGCSIHKMTIAQLQQNTCQYHPGPVERTDGGLDAIITYHCCNYSGFDGVPGCVKRSHKMLGLHLENWVKQQK